MTGKLFPPPSLQRDNITAQFVLGVIKRTNIANVTTLADDGATVSNPPTQAEVQAIYDKVDELITAMTAAETMDS